MLVERSVMEQRYEAVMAVLRDGEPIVEVAARVGVSRQSLHAWIARYEEGGITSLADRSHRPVSCPHQMSPEVEAELCELRRRHPGWGPTRLAYVLARRGIEPAPSRSAVYRALVRHRLIETGRRKRRKDWVRWERHKPMELWQLDVVGGIVLGDGTELKALTGVDDYSRFCVVAGLMERATSRAVCGHFVDAIRAHGVPEEVLTDNGKVFTGRHSSTPSSSHIDRHGGPCPVSSKVRADLRRVLPAVVYQRTLKRSVEIDQRQHNPAPNLGAVGAAGAVKTWVHRRWRLLRHFGVIPKRAVVVLGLSLLAGALSTPAMALATGWLIGRIADVARGASTSTIVAPLALIGVMIAYELMVSTAIAPVRMRAIDRVDGAVRQRIRRAVGNRPGIEHLEDQAYRDLAALPTADWDSIGNALVAQLQVITRYTGALVSAAIVASVAPLAAAAAFAVLVAKRLYLRTIYAAFLSDMGRSIMPQLRAGQYWRDVASTIAGAKELRVFGFADSAVRRFDESNTAHPQMYAQTFRRAAVKAWPAWLAEGVAVGLPLVVLVQRALDGDVSVGQLAAVLTAVLGMLSIGGVGNETYMVEATLNSVEALDQLEALSAAPARRPRRSTNGIGDAEEPGPPTITFDGVGFTYPGSDTPIFRHLDLELAPGQSVAIVGENGVGKSTLIKLLARFYEPTSGRILADGVDIAALPVEEWRARLAVVFQGFKQLGLPARHNIALADWDHPDRERLLELAVEGSGAREVVAALPHGLDTVLSRQYRDGAELSGGQWQRVALARALYAASVGADVLVLDEPTAHLDVNAEVALFEQLMTHSSGKTAIVVSHRYSTVRRAERIIVLASGRVIEDGTHAELVALGGTYANLYQLQAGAFTAGLG